MITGNPMPHHWDLQWVLTYKKQKQQYDHRNANANLLGLTVATSHKQRKQNMDVRCQSVWAYSHIHSMILGNKCQLAGTYSCILTYNQTMQHDHRRANANLQGLTIASSQSNKQNRSYEWPMRSYTLSFHIIGANGQKRWTYNCPQWANNNDSITKANEMIMH
jgi:hypothetical protein